MPHPPLFPPAGLNVGDFRPAELRLARERLKNKKAAGTDSISNEFLRLFMSIDEGFAFMLELMNQCWRSKTLPAMVHIARIVAIFKKGQAVPANFRPISLLCTVYRLFTSLIALRLEKVVPRISEHQFGYQKGKSVDNAIFRILRSIENCSNWKNLGIYILLLDWNKCFDRIHKNPLLNALERMGIEQPYIQMLDAIYSSKSFFVQDAFGKSNTQPQITGLAQGDPLSCILLNCLTTVLMRDAEEAWTQRFIDNNSRGGFFKSLFGFDHVLFADDTNLISADIQSLKEMLHTVQIQAQMYGLTLNFDKTVLLRIGASKLLPPPSLRAVDGEPIMEREMGKTLGFLIGSKDTTKTTVQNKIRDIHFTMKQFKFIWQSKVSIKKKLDKFHSLVVSKTWGVHLLTLRKGDFRRLESAYLRCVRRILGIKAAYISRISDSAVLKKAGLPSFQTTIRVKQFALLGHILRLGPTHPDWKVCLNPDWQGLPCHPTGILKRIGRPRAQWAEQLFSLFKSTFPNYSRAEIVSLAQNRNRWGVATWRLSST